MGKINLTFTPHDSDPISGSSSYTGSGKSVNYQLSVNEQEELLVQRKPSPFNSDDLESLKKRISEKLGNKNSLDSSQDDQADEEKRKRIAQDILEVLTQWEEEQREFCFIQDGGNVYFDLDEFKKHIEQSKGSIKDAKLQISKVDTIEKQQAQEWRQKEGMQQMTVVFGTDPAKQFAVTISQHKTNQSTDLKYTTNVRPDLSIKDPDARNKDQEARQKIAWKGTIELMKMQFKHLNPSEGMHIELKLIEPKAIEREFAELALKNGFDAVTVGNEVYELAAGGKMTSKEERAKNAAMMRQQSQSKQNGDEPSTNNGVSPGNSTPKPNLFEKNDRVLKRAATSQGSILPDSAPPPSLGP